MSNTNNVFDDDKLLKLTEYDIIPIVDDSGSMGFTYINGKRLWDLLITVLSCLAETMCTLDQDGIDILLLNHRTNASPSDNFHHGYYGIKSKGEMMNILNNVRPTNGTPTGATLKKILDWYLPKLNTTSVNNLPKKLIIPIFTDGHENLNGSLQKEIERAIHTLQDNDCPEGQLVFSLVQIGNDVGVKQLFQVIDDGLKGNNGINRDIVDATCWDDIKHDLEGAAVKILVGAIDPDVDRTTFS